MFQRQCFILLPTKSDTSIAYLNSIKSTYEDKPEVYKSFVALMDDFRKVNVDVAGIIEAVFKLFEDQPSLIKGLKAFLPPSHRIEKTEIQSSAKSSVDPSRTRSSYHDIMSDSGENIRICVFNKA
ncbi:Transcriptional regulatory protein sin3 [Tulasnella sp. 418]|nr:Transcriptional regulatory protein sin3 [Tulasnella sp. 418]